jgi:gliding motility-associated-like protein
LLNQQTPNVNFLSATPNLSGTYTLTIHAPGGCNSLPTSLYLPIQAKPLTPVVTTNSPVCEGTQVVLNTQAYTGTPLSYEWFYNGGTGMVSKGITYIPQLTLDSVQASQGGAYTVQVSHDGCISDFAGNAYVQVLQKPVNPAPIATYSFAPTFCAGGVLTLSATGDTTHTYSWTGPNGFTATDKNPTISNASIANNGSYMVTVNNGSCTITKTVQVNFIIPQPNEPIVNSSGNICVGNTITLNTQLYVGNNVSYLWNGPNGNYTTTSNVLTINPTTVANSGTYTVTVHVDGCTNVSDTFGVSIFPAPQVFVPTTNGQTCAGDTLHLMANITDSTVVNYLWTGPNGFTSTLENPIINNANAAINTGSYTLTATTDKGCGASVAVQILVKPRPTTPSLVNTSPICHGTDLIFSTNSYNGNSVIYVWTISDSTVMTNVPNLIISSADTSWAGIASLVVNVDGCNSLPSPTSQVLITPMITTPIATNNTSLDSSICVGDGIQLETNFIQGATYQWIGPAGFMSAVRNPFIANAAAMNSGDYSVRITLNNCVSDTGTTTVYIDAYPIIPTIINTSPVCVGSSLTLSVPTPKNGVIYDWYDAETDTLIGTGTAATIPYATMNMMGNFYAIATLNNCSAPASQNTWVEVDEPADDQAFVGLDLMTCSEGPLMIEATLPLLATGTWQTPNNDITIVTPSVFNTLVFGLEQGENIFIWSLSSGACIAYDVDTLLIYREYSPTAEDDLIITELNVDTMFNILANDNVTTNVQVELITIPMFGVLEDLGNGDFNYIPNSVFVGDDMFKYVVRNENCPELQDTATVIIRVNQGSGCDAPNIITPNEDGLNDALFFNCVEVNQGSQVIIFNRYGTEVYKSTDYQNDWKGTYNDENLPDGTYFYILKIEGEAPLKGFFVIQR